MWVFVLVVLALILGVYFTLKQQGKTVQAHSELHNDWLSKNNVKLDVDYEYVTHSSKGVFIAARYIIDMDKQTCYLRNDFAHGGTVNPLQEFVSVPFADVVGAEIIEDSVVTGGIGRAVAGGILAGGVGAVVGAVTAKPHVSSYKMAIYTNKIANPQIVLTLINTKERKDSINYKQAVEFTSKVNASIKAIIANQ